MFLGEADRILLRLRGPAAFPLFPHIALHKCLLRGTKLRVIVGSGRNAALREIHHAIAVKDDVGDVGAGIGLADFEFDTRVAAEVSFVVD